MNNFLGNLYDAVVYRPQLNLLQFFFDITGDIGFSIALLAIAVNLILLPFFASAYINGQKMKIYQPRLKEIRENNKDNPQEMLKQMQAFYKKHNIRNSSVFYVLIIQILLASALWSLTRNISTAQTVNGVVELPGLYENIFNRSVTNFDQTAFGFLPISESAQIHLWLPITTALFSFLYGVYTFKLAPKTNIIPLQNNKEDSKKEKQKDKKSLSESDKKEVVSPFDDEAFQKSMQFQTMYIIPTIMFVVNISLTAGVNIYFLTVSILSLIRQVILTNYYATHTGKLLEDIAESDPTSRDDDPFNNIESIPTGDITSMNEVPELVLTTEEKIVTAPQQGKSNQNTKKKTKTRNVKKSVKKK